MSVFPPRMCQRDVFSIPEKAVGLIIDDSLSLSHISCSYLSCSYFYNNNNGIKEAIITYGKKELGEVLGM